jgi:hypothetical protein
MYHVEDHSLYPDTGEENLKDIPPEKGPKFRMAVYVDADHAHDLVTRRSIAGFLFMLQIRLSDEYINDRRQWIHQLMDQNWWHQGLLQNSFLRLATCFGHWE